MIENNDAWIKKNVKCCACGCTLETSAFMTLCITSKIATWKIPIFGSLDCPDFPPRATAYVCDVCLINKTNIRYCIEFEISTGQVTYHDVDSLVDINAASCKKKHYFGKLINLEMSSPARNKFMLKAARERSVN